MPVGSEAQQQIVCVTNVPEEVIQEAGEDGNTTGERIEAKIFVSRLITKTYA